MNDQKIVRFSIIIPTFNRAELLNKLLLSLNNQTYKFFEIIICDDGSTDNTKEIVNNHKTNFEITYVYQENTGGPATPRNIGISLAKFDWLCFLDSDDDWSQNKLERLREYILCNKYDIYCHKVSMVDIYNKVIRIAGSYKRGFLLNDFNSLVYNGNQVVNSSLCIRKSIISEQLMYDTSPIYKGIEDYIFILKLTYSGFSIMPISENLGFYRLHDSNISLDKKAELDKHKLYFSECTFNNINISKLNALFSYTELLASDENNLIKFGKYLNICFHQSTFEIKIKSFLKMITALVRISQK